MMRFDLLKSSDGATGATGATGFCRGVCSGRCYSPLCNRGVAASRRTTTVRHKNKTPEPWPPADLSLPSTIEAIEQGREQQRGLFDERSDDTRAGRLARLLTVPGMTTGDRLVPPGGIGGKILAGGAG